MRAATGPLHGVSRLGCVSNAAFAVLARVAACPPELPDLGNVVDNTPHRGYHLPTGRSCASAVHHAPAILRRLSGPRFRRHNWGNCVAAAPSKGPASD